MRLIDADKLVFAIQHELWDWKSVDGITATTVLKQTISDIANEPTVEAIPIEFIEEYIEYQDTEEQKVLRMMWHAWELCEKENEID